jgi:hypothetical protein
MDESHIEKIAKIDANVEHIIKELSIVRELTVDSAINKREHRIAFAVISLLAVPILHYVFKKLGFSSI